MPTALQDRPAAARSTDLRHRFDQAAAAAPDRTAVVTDGGALTFGELDRRVDRLAALLRSAGARRGSVVGVSLPRCTDLLVAFLAAWRVGAAYLPLDPAHPRARARWMVADAGATVVVTAGRDGDWPQGCAVATLEDLTAAPADHAAVAAVPPSPLGEADPAYVIYTSGSTGRPKGVLVSHGNVAWLGDALEAAGLYAAGHRVVGWNASASFDASVQQWARVCRGDTIVLFGEELRTESAGLAAFVRRHGVTDLDATPSHWEALHDDLVATGGPPLRLLLGGEAVPARLWQRLAEARRAGTVEAVNVYGPTECTVDATAAPIDGDDPNIGRPLPGVRAHVLDASLRPAAPGQPGELYLAGPGVAHGYTNRLALTAQRFVADPSGPPGARMYRTGDRVRCRAGGTLEYLGRVDRQVKLHGHRIELGEVEAALARHPGISRAVVVLRDVPGAGPSLVAYHTPAGGGPPVTGEAVRAHAAAHLPGAMVPSLAVPLATLPLTVSGKVDHAALPDPPAAAPGGAGEDGLRSPVERLVAETWSDVLGTGSLTADADFFALGGHSLQALRLVARLKKRLGGAVPTRLVYAHPRLRDYAAEVEAASAAAGPDRPAAAASS